MMNKKYNEYCMKFSNKELKKYLYDKLCENNNIYIQCISADGDEMDITSSEKIDTIVFDERENVSIMFLDYQTSIFAYDIEIMFIDEDSKGTYTASDVYDNVVYEGKLREMSHEEMLQMFFEIILCFVNAETVSMTQLDVPGDKYKMYNYYKPYMYIIEVKNNHTMEKTNVYENITINY